MDANEFLRKVQPAARKSRLTPFLPDLLKLRQAGCTLEQLRDFLKANEVEISVAGLSAYLRRQEDRRSPQQPPSTAGPARPSAASPSMPPAAPPEDPPAELLKRLSKETK